MRTRRTEYNRKCRASIPSRRTFCCQIIQIELSVCIRGLCCNNSFVLSIDLLRCGYDGFVLRFHLRGTLVSCLRNLNVFPTLRASRFLPRSRFSKFSIALSHPVDCQMKVLRLSWCMLLSKLLLSLYGTQKFSQKTICVPRSFSVQFRSSFEVPCFCKYETAMAISKNCWWFCRIDRKFIFNFSGKGQTQFQSCAKNYSSADNQPKMNDS